MEATKQEVVRLKGMPAGVGLAIAEEDGIGFQWTGGDQICRSPVFYGALVAVPLNGYEFKYNIHTDSYMAVIQFSDPREIKASFMVRNSFEEAIVNGLLKRINEELSSQCS